MMNYQKLRAVMNEPAVDTRMDPPHLRRCKSDLYSMLQAVDVYDKIVTSIFTPSLRAGGCDLWFSSR